MAKVSGALFSIDASGTYAGKLVFAKWKGRQYVRNHVIPSNPMTIGQVTSRNRVRVTGAAQRFINLTTLKGDGRASTDQVLLTAAAPSGQAWNGYLSKEMIGSAGVTYTAAEAAYAALVGGEKTAWNNAAAALTPAIPAVAQKGALNVAATAKTAGEVHFIMQYGLYTAGIASIPTATPPTYA